MNVFKRLKRKSAPADAILGLIPEADEAARRALRAVKPFTMTGYERLWAVWQAMHHIAAKQIEGDIVECGVWKGAT
jgi:hypothetical protein